ncbi:hypothetical protein ABT084_16095 [Streptomyces sp. NPDC002138]|uniref:hypothetical protein n=1 Tax=Streptomyces sp. NPDC002138 TaxID=3154410 RepID=UPI003322D124
MAEAVGTEFVEDGPTSAEREACDEVRRRATGMSHHESAEALEEAERAAAQLDGAAGDEAVDAADVRTRAALAEWERITDVLSAHGGPYAPETDPYVQGQLAGRRNRRGAGSGRVG